MSTSTTCRAVAAQHRPGECADALAPAEWLLGSLAGVDFDDQDKRDLMMLPLMDEGDAGGSELDF
jgi:hypothetical protein